MKKLLSIVICVLLGITSVWSADYSGKITLRAVSKPEYGGTVQVIGGYSSGHYNWIPICDGWTTEETTWGIDVSKRVQNQSFYCATEVYTGSLNANANVGFKFAGWSMSEDGSNLDNSSTKTISVSYAESDRGEKKYFAYFECLHRYLHKAEVVSMPIVSGDVSVPVGVVSCGFGTLITDVTTIPEAQWSETKYTYDKSSTDGPTTVTVTQENGNNVFSYTVNYYAQPVATGYVFDGWYANEEDAKAGTNKLSSEARYQHKVTISQEIIESSSQSDYTNHNPSLAPLYAKFRLDTYYYYSGAYAAFANNSEIAGEITVTNTNASLASVDAETLAPFSKSTSTATAIDDQATSYKVVPKAEVDYSFTYKVEKTDDKTTFMGWSLSPYGGVYLQPTPNPTYTGNYTAYSMDKEDPTITPAVYAVFLSYWYKDPTAVLTTSSLGMGKVAVEYGDDAPTYYNEVIGTNINQIAIPDATHPEEGVSYEVRYYAQANHGSYFQGWALVDNPNKIVADHTHNPYVVSYTTNSTRKDQPYEPLTVYAVFQSEIDILQQDKMICYQTVDGVSNINDAKVIIDFDKANTLRAELVGADKEYFILYDKSYVDKGADITLSTSEGITTLIVAYNPEKDINEAVGKKAEVQLTANYGGSDVVRKVAITVENIPVVSFLPSDGKGAYSIANTDGRGTHYMMAIDETENINLPITHESMSTFELNLTTDKADDGLTFYGWQLTTSEGSEYISYEKKCTYTFSKPSVVRPIFTADNVAVFTILGDPDPDNKYDDLQMALDDAVEIGEHVVVFSNNGKVEGTLQQGNYTVPSGVTLLIPGVGPGDDITMNNTNDDDKYVYRLKHRGTVQGTSKDADIILSPADYQTTTAAPKAFRKLKFQDNTTINVSSDANLYLYALLNRDGGQGYEARPHRYGQIVMGENCQIILNDKATLYTFGFITGPMSSRVIAKSGSEVHEVFQYSDPRGGAGVAHLYLYREKYRVFPFSQYYVQNVEVPLELQYGATEYVSTTADVLQQFVIATTFIVKKEDTRTGLFRIKPNTSLIKYYDPLTDRLTIVVEGKYPASSGFELGSIIIELGDVTPGLGDLGGVVGFIMNDLKNVTLNSDDYAMPINGNVDVIVNNSTIDATKEFAFLAGSTMTLDAASTFNVKGKVYVYDADENLLPKDMRTHPTSGAAVADYAAFSGYFSASAMPLKPISNTPEKTHLLTDMKTSKRQAKDVKDSKWIINGTINVDDGAGLYTTAGGAQLISYANGKVVFKSTVNNATTYQAKYVTSDKTKLLSENGTHNKASYAVNSAKLQHADGTYQTTTAGTYTYNPATGRWETNVSANTVLGHQFTVTLPSPATVNKTVIANLSDVTSTDGITATIAWNGGTSTAVSGITYNNGLNIPISYAVTNKAGEYEGVLTIKSGTTTIATPRIIVTEDYTPAFTINGEDNPKYTTSARLGYQSESALGIIVPKANNVAGLVSGTYTSNWSYEITGENADEFSLVWGEGDAKLTNSKVVFKPKTVGSKKTATLSVTCTYTDAAKVVHTTTVAIALEASATTLTTNTLAFADGVESIFISKDAQPLFKNINSSAAITIDPATNDVVTIEIIDGQYKIAPKALGSVTITATQEADLENGIAATTITKTINVTDDVVWNWQHLYFGSENIRPVTTKYNEWTLTIAEYVDKDNDGHPDVEDGDVIIANPHPGVLDLEEITEGDYKATLANWEEGETYIWFAFNYVDGEDEKTKYFKSEVYRDPRFLSISVNDDYIYEAVTNSFDKITYNNGSVTFNSSDNQISTWTFGFKGIPDLLSFTAEGENNWQIEESSNGTNWSIAYTWAPIAEGVPFELALQPASQYVRISYATGANPEGVISNISVSELKTVRADVDKLYMPLIDGGVTKNVVFTYVSADGYNLSTSHNFFTTDLDDNKLPGLNIDPFYMVKRVGVNSVATEEILGSLKVDNTETNIPIQTFEYPQSIPVQLASDHSERFFYVTSEAYKTSWNADKRTVVMNNAVADASPYVVFHFADSPVPGVISFNFPTTAHGTWEVMESADATKWNPLVANSTQNIGNGFVMQDFQHPTTSRYVRVKYVSDYAEVVELTNLSILPTTSVTVNPYELEVYDDQNEKVTVTANNLKQVSFNISEGFQIVNESGNPTNFESTFTTGGTISSDIYIDYTGDASATYGELTITTTKDAEGNTIAEKVLTTVKLTGLKRNLTNGNTGIKTGVPDDYKINGFDKVDNYAEAKYRDVVTTNAFADNKALFDYVIIYGETTTSDESKTITTPTSTAGSNAKTPCYIYQKNGEDYQLISVVENANSSTKSWKGTLQTNGGSLKVYITGFCPYASTGYTKADEGVWYFQGAEDENIDIYLEDCYIYSRYKSKRGNSFSRSNGETFSDKVARGSGAVLLFANTAESNTKPLNVTIHTRGKNLLKSHYGCLYESIVGRAFQISSPVHVYMQSEAHYKNSYTELNFTDEWPISGGGTERTNGFLSLQKQVNNAPSIDMGNKNTVVNFRGGRVELQNALNSSDNYESTLAISYRTGIYGPEKFKFTLAHGIGTDGVEGRVNFYDGTTTVKSMEVPERYRQYYLMDGENEELSTTSCLRSQKYTFVYGGSHCMMRACSEPTSKGGAPTDGTIVGDEAMGNPLGLYQYPQSEGWTANGSYGLVTPTKFPGELQKDGNNLSNLHATYPEGKYGVSSITPAAGNYLNLWVPGGYGVGKQPEVDQKISYWKACMTHIEASYGVYGGEIGGMTTIGTDAEGNQTELVYNLLYCEIDDNISGVITGSNAAIQYSATVLNPAPTENEDEKYIEIPHDKISVDDELQNYITNEHDYKVQTRVYYIVPAKADVWMNFTAPFDVENVYIMETFDESLLEEVQPIEDPFNPGEMFSKRESIKIEQAKHNADFAGFFGVALALESKKPFWEIYEDYMGWAKYTDKKEGRWDGSSPYTLRGKYKLRHYYQKTEKDPVTGKDITTSNWNSSDYVLYKNNGPWEWDASYNEGEGRYIAKWDFVIPTEGEPLMKQGQTYSLQFPYCTGCWDESNERDFWDYWTGKFLIFESTDGGADGHTIKGSSFVGSKFNGEWFDYDDSKSFLSDYKDYETGEQALLLGNQTFAMMGATQANLWTYEADENAEGFNPSTDKDGNPILSKIKPTGSFLIANVQLPEQAISVKSISRNGNVTYNYGSNPGDGTTTGTHTPTVGGGNDMFITGIAGGINIAVAAPQFVQVVNATGHIIYCGYVANNVDVILPMNGIYVVKGENEAQKIFF
jgi:hypothetical protein